MEHPLSDLLAKLGERPHRTSLHQLEAAVLQRLPRRETPMDWRWRAAVAAAMLGIGAIAGSGAAARPVEHHSPFAADHAYAVSTLLEVGQ